MDSIFLMGFDVWGVGFSEQQYLDECRNSAKYQQGQWYCLERQHTLVSSLIVYKNCFKIRDNFAGFGSIATVPHRRGEGCASTLIKSCIDGLKSAGCKGVYLHNETESEIYGRLGFRMVSASKDSQLMFLEIRDGSHVSSPSNF